jgi:type I restriction enzyme S subunit
MGEWKERILRELINIKHGYAFKGEFFSEIPNNNLLLTPGNFHIGGGFKDDKFKYYSGNIPNEYILSEGDVIVTMTDLSKAGDTLGYSAKIPRSEKNFLHNQRLGLVEIISEEVDKDFIYWLLRTKSYQKNIVNSCSGSTVKHTSPTKIRDYSFLLPPLEEQKAIASVLSCLDAKIENLRKQNNTLEQIAQTLFKHWFIDFEFPNTDGKPYKSSGGKMQSSVLGDIPVGWQVGKLEDIVLLSTGKGLEKSALKDDGQYSVIGANGKIGKTDKFLIDYPVIITGRVGTIGIINISIKKVWISDNTIIFSPSKNYFYYVYFWLKGTNLKVLNRGSTQPLITQGDLKKLEIFIPSDRIINEFKKISTSLFNKKIKNEEQIQTLKNTRDTLLPKLMSGELRVKE